MKKIGNLFWADFYIDTQDKNVFDKVSLWFDMLEARERRISAKEIELDLERYKRD